jgi:Tfp pilus assembly protein PilV
MNMKPRLVEKSKGIGLIEILIVIAVLAVGLTGVISFLIFSRGVTFQIARTTEATTLAEEGLEAVRGLRDESWATNIATLDTSTPATYYPVVSVDKWTLTTTNPGVINNLYTRVVVVEDVGRDGNDDIASSGGANDPKTKKVTSTITWTEAGRNKQVVLTTYITDIFGN